MGIAHDNWRRRVDSTGHMSDLLEDAEIELFAAAKTYSESSEDPIPRRWFSKRRNLRAMCEAAHVYCGLLKMHAQAQRAERAALMAAQVESLRP